jgi:MerR family copper efflux transcriptional regulator
MSQAPGLHWRVVAEDLSPIGRVAETVGLSLRTIRYYEEMGLVRPSGRTNGGFRLYDTGDIERLLLIKRMKPLGYPLEEMARLLRLIDALTDATRSCPGAGGGQLPSAREAAEELQGYVQAVRDRITDLETKVAYAEEFRDRLLHELERFQGTLVTLSAPGPVTGE